MIKKTSLIKPCNYETNYLLPVLIPTKNGYIRKERYYECEYLLYKAYRQLKAINGVMQPLEPIIIY